MTKKEIVQRKRRLEKAIKMNRNVIKNESSPHLKDIARYRITLFKIKLEKLEKVYIKRYGY